MTQPHIPAHDADSARDAETASAPSYPQRSTAQDHSATQELPAAQDATREMPSAATIPAPPAGAVPPASAPATPAPSAQEAPASGGTQQAPSVGGAYSAPSGQPYSGYTAPASPDAFASPTVIVTKKGPGWVALLGPRPRTSTGERWPQCPPRTAPGRTGRTLPPPCRPPS